MVIVKVKQSGYLCTYVLLLNNTCRNSCVIIMKHFNVSNLTCECGLLDMVNRVKRPTSCSCVLSAERSGLLRVKFGAGEAGFRNSSSAESELDMASPGFSVSPAAENTTITLGRGSVRLS